MLVNKRNLFAVKRIQRTYTLDVEVSHYVEETSDEEEIDNRGTESVKGSVKASVKEPVKQPVKANVVIALDLTHSLGVKFGVQVLISIFELQLILFKETESQEASTSKGIKRKKKEKR